MCIKAMEKTLVSLDTETDGLHGELLGISFGREIDGELVCQYLTPKTTNIREKVLELYENHIPIFHNAKYDLQQLKRLGIPLPDEFHDTILIAHLLGTDSMGLKDLAVKVLGVDPDEVKKIGKDFDVNNLSLINDTEEFQQYAVNDASWTYQLFNELYPVLAKDKDLLRAYKFELKLVPVLADMEDRGIEIDVDFLTELKKQVQQEMVDGQTKLYKLAGEVFNLQSPKQLKEVFARKFGVQVPSTNRGTLRSLLRRIKGRKGYDDLQAFINELFEYKKRAKLVSTYMDNIIAMLDEDNRLHGSFNQTGTATGRLSSSAPNMQNMPAHDEWGYRKAFRASKGHKLVVADYSQIELRVLAHFSGDLTMIEAFRSGVDLHSTTAKKLFDLDCPVEEVKEKYPERRSFAKTINFGIVYGMSAKALAEQVGVTEHQAEQFIKNYFYNFFMVKGFIEQTRKFAQYYGYVPTMSGRKRWLDLNDYKWVRQSVNTRIQGSAADIMKKAMIELYRKLQTLGDEAHILLQVHDEIVVEVPENKAEYYKTVILDVLNDIVKLEVPITAEADIGDTWWEAK